ncbi:hypothetical protein [Caulobacter sp.]|uniref:hypothetical protein n=1 Tax=Caulobacter sp. TaxID=78 RepID=UPI0031D2D3A9
MTVRVFVEPIDQGWAVRACQVENGMFYRTGAEAEAAARDLCQRLADAGEPAVLEIKLRGGARAGRFLFPPDPAAPLIGGFDGPRPAPTPKHPARLGPYRSSSAA